jgi:pyruvate formate-lyase activating enzyme-like uncharacterized protein
MSMPLLVEQRACLVELNRLEYGGAYSSLSFLLPDNESRSVAQRDELLATLAGRVALGCGGTKLDMHALAPGCQICVEGDWSCLFINGRCNAHCFYCPSRQAETGPPSTNTVVFRFPADYAAYLEQFGFRGMSLSGGEPLLTPNRSLAFLSAAKKRLGDRLHSWLYSNGTLVNRDILLQLRDAGLDEIRFDIGATAYSLEKARLAVGIIPTVTVEIPAVPEDVLLLGRKMVEMADLGINHLNLHQLRLTPYSLRRFAGRPYTFLHGEKVTVLESELTALRLVQHGLDAGIELPVNYCSFVYKNRYQKVAARRRSAACMRKSFETITSAGFLRTLWLVGETGELSRQLEAFRSDGRDPFQWDFNPARDRLAFAPGLLDLVDFTHCRLIVTYTDTATREQLSYRNPFREFKLPSGRKIVVERWTADEIEFSGADLETFVQQFLIHGNDRPASQGDGLSRAHACECIVEGLQEYF